MLEQSFRREEPDLEAGIPILEGPILVVDDEEPIRDELTGYLGDKGYRCAAASNASQAMEIIRNDPDVCIVLCDIRMPGQDGLQMLTAIRGEVAREIAFIVLTGHGGKDEAIRALRLGAEDFLEKPLDLRHLLHAIERAQEMLALKRSQQLTQESLAAEVALKTASIRRLIREVEIAYEEVLDILALAADFKDEETGNHIRRVGLYARFLAAQLGWPKDRQRIIELAAPLHDVGKIGTPDHILQKQGELEEFEAAVIHQHAEIGAKILSHSSDKVLACAANIAAGHHERWDGTGYPAGLAGNAIPIEARITAIGDVYDALRSTRPYKPALGHDEAVSIMINGDDSTRPQHFDPDLLALFARYHGRFDEIYESLAD